MNGKPDNLSELVRRALMAQADMGIGEVVLRAPQTAAPAETARLLTEGERVVSVSQALAADADQGLAYPVKRTIQTEQKEQKNMAVPTESKFANLEDHRAAICDCQKCSLGKIRNKFVYGVGNPEADIMFVGEAPGAKEDELGEPFVGRAGELLDKILVAMHLDRQQVYIANILKCRPPGNRDPQPDEMQECFPYLRQQVRLIQPKVMCALGRIAAQALLDTKTPLGKLRGEWHAYEGVPLLVTYHPAALLRFPKYKHDTWEDMQLLLKHYETLKA